MTGGLFHFRQRWKPGNKLLLTCFLEHAARKTKRDRCAGGTRSASFGGAAAGARGATVCGFLRGRDRPLCAAGSCFSLPRSSAAIATGGAPAFDCLELPSFSCRPPTSGHVKS